MNEKKACSLKEEILLASCQPGVRISSVAKAYGIPVSCLYHWRRMLPSDKKRWHHDPKERVNFIEAVADEERRLGEIAIKARISLARGEIKIKGTFDVGQLLVILAGMRTSC